MKRFHVHVAVHDLQQSIGLDHLGLQAETGTELEEIGSRLAQADVSVTPQKGAACCAPAPV